MSKTEQDEFGIKQDANDYFNNIVNDGDIDAKDDMGNDQDLDDESESYDEK